MLSETTLGGFSMKLYRAGGGLLLVATLCQLAQILYSLGLFAGVELSSKGVQFFLFGALRGLWTETGHGFGYSDLISAAYSGLAMLSLMICALVVIRGERLWLGAKIFMLMVLLFLFSDHLYSGMMMESFCRVSADFFPRWYQVQLEVPFYLLFVSLSLIILSSPITGSYAEPCWRWKLLSLKGRIPRSTFWLYYVIGMGAFSGYCYLIAIYALGPFGHFGELTLLPSLILAAHIYSIVLWPSIALITKRCHDRNHSGWFQLLMLVPLVNFYCWINLLFLRGTEGPNRFNSDWDPDAEVATFTRDFSGTLANETAGADFIIEEDPDLSPPLPGDGSLLLYQVGGYMLALAVIFDLGIAMYNLHGSNDLWFMALPTVALLLSFVLAIRAVLCKVLPWWGLTILILAAGYRFGGHLVVWARFGEMFFENPDYASQMAVSESIFLLAICGAGLILGNFSAARMADLPGTTDRLRWLLFSTQGRISRSQFFWGQVFVTVLAGVFFLLLIFILSPPDLSGAFASAVLLLHLILLSSWPMLALATKRCHDRDKSGWYQLLNFVPLLNIYYTIEMLFFRGSEGTNRYGNAAE